jgi:hypothetical protein
MAPTTISEEQLDGGAKFVLQNARPKGMRVAIMVVTPLIVALIGLTAANDFHDGHWGMGLVRVLFCIVVATAARFTLFGEESVQVTPAELLWLRGKNFERRCAVADIEQLERQGNQLRVIVKGQTPIVIGSGLRQPPSNMAWLSDRLEAAIKLAREDGKRSDGKKKK